MSHNTQVISQFTKLASAFAAVPQFTDGQALDLLLQATGASKNDKSLDVACGAGVVACHFAAHVRQARGIDITPAMLEKARERQRHADLSNVNWDIGDVANLPYPDSSFSIVTSRYAMHHMQSPEAVLREMVRVCQSDGRLVIADICVPEDTQEADLFNQLERMNDPSHVRALSLSEWMALFQGVSLPEPTVSTYKLEFPLARMLRASNLSNEYIDKVDQLVRKEIGSGRLANCARLENGECIFGYPIAVIAAQKLAHDAT